LKSEAAVSKTHFAFFTGYFAFYGPPLPFESSASDVPIVSQILRLIVEQRARNLHDLAASELHPELMSPSPGMRITPQGPAKTRRNSAQHETVDEAVRLIAEEGRFMPKHTGKGKGANGKDTIAPGTGAAGRQNGAKRIKKNQTNSGKDAVSKGAMRVPTQQAAAVGDREELKEALQNLEETKGDWSKGG
jgi:hypothetical protein